MHWSWLQLRPPHLTSLLLISWDYIWLQTAEDLFVTGIENFTTVPNEKPWAKQCRAGIRINMLKGMIVGRQRLISQMKKYFCCLLGLLFALKGVEQASQSPSCCLFCMHRYVHVCVVCSCSCSCSCVHTYTCRGQRSAAGYLPSSLLTFEARSLNLELISLPSLAGQWASRCLPVSASPAQEL